ncbi:MAG: dephospho-CoA kinase [Bacteroidota bacterium]
MLNSPLLVGITGGIGSGKSTVCKIFEVLGHKVYYADDRAKWLMENDLQLINEIKLLFGSEAYKDGHLNRKWIAEKVFKSQDLLSQLNAKVHPAVGEDLKNWAEQNNTEKILFDEAALLFEVGSYKKMDKNILVMAPEEIRIDRVVRRDPHRSPKSVKDIIDKQMSDEEKTPLADFVIKNDGSDSLIRQAMAVYSDLI